MIDARKHHNPAIVPVLIDQATEKSGGQKELAARLGVTPRYLQLLARGEREASYVMQATLEQIIKGG